MVTNKEEGRLLQSMPISSGENMIILSCGLFVEASQLKLEIYSTIFIIINGLLSLTLTQMLELEWKEMSVSHSQDV